MTPPTHQHTTASLNELVIHRRHRLPPLPMAVQSSSIQIDPAPSRAPCPLLNTPHWRPPSKPFQEIVREPQTPAQHPNPVVSLSSLAGSLAQQTNEHARAGLQY